MLKYSIVFISYWIVSYNVVLAWRQSCTIPSFLSRMPPKRQSSSALAALLAASKPPHLHSLSIEKRVKQKLTCSGWHSTMSHAFDVEEIGQFQVLLMDWYIKSQRKMPWRIPAVAGNGAQGDCPGYLHAHADPGLRAYQGLFFPALSKPFSLCLYIVWVSEIMLQQVHYTFYLVRNGFLL